MFGHEAVDLRCTLSVLASCQIFKKEVLPLMYPKKKNRCILQVKLSCNAECNNVSTSFLSGLRMSCFFTANVPVWGLNLTMFLPIVPL